MERDKTKKTSYESNPCSDPEPEACGPLKELGLELKVEPSFGFYHAEKPRPDGFYEMEKTLAPEGLDISLYKDGKLLLSPIEFYNLQKHEDAIDRTQPREVIIPIFRQLIEILARHQPGDLRRIYEIKGADLVKLNLDSREFYRFTRGYSDGKSYDYLFLVDEKETDKELLSHITDIPYPANRFADKNLGHISSLYFVHSNHFTDQTIDRAMHLALAEEDNSALRRISEAAIMSLSYGHRLRTFGINPNLINRAINTL